MANTGLPWEIPYQLLTDPPNGPLGQQELAEKTASGLGMAWPCTSATRPAHVAGRIIYETDTGQHLISDGDEWKQLAYGDDTGWQDAVQVGVTAASGMSITGGEIKRCNGVVSFYISLTTTAGFGAGDIGNVSVLTVPSGYRPGAAVMGGFNGGAAGNNMTFNMTNTGILVLANTGAAFAAGAPFNATGTYLI